MAQESAAPTGFTFDQASLNLAPQQPSRVRRAWERVPTKAVQHKARTVWKRAEAKSIQYETEQGGTGFSIKGTKRLRTKNVPAFPVKTGRGVDREQEAEATDDELFSRRRKSGRRSSINPARKAVPSPKSRLISAPRPSRFSANPPRSPLKNIRVMELSHSPRGENKKARPSIGGVLGNGTPMRNAFAESSWKNRSPPRPVFSPKKELSPQKAFSPQLFSPPRQLSPARMFSPQKVFSQQVDSSCDQISIPRFSPQMHARVEIPIPKQNDLTGCNVAVFPYEEDFSTIEQPRPRRRSARLSGSFVTPEVCPADPVPAQTAGLSASETSEPAGIIESELPGAQSRLIPGIQEASLLAEPQIGKSPIVVEDAIDEPSLQLQAELGAPVSPTKITMFPKRGRVEQVEDEDQTKLFNEIHATFEAKDTPERMTSPRKRSPKLPEAEISQAGAIQTESPAPASQEQVVLGGDYESSADIEGDVDDVSEDELTARLEDWTDPAVTSPDHCEPESSQSRNTPRLSDDTNVLKAFLSRAQAKRAAQALTAPDGSPVRASPRRSPRRALETVDGNSPSPPKSPHKSPAKSPSKQDQKSRLGNTPPSKPQTMFSFDADESDELASPVKPIRRSARPKPTAQYKTAPSLIPLRRPDGQEPPRLRKTEAQELAIVTRSNTRRNKGQAQMPMHVLRDLSTRELSPVKSRPSLPGAKAVDWNTELVEYFGEQTKAKAKAKTGAKRTKGLGTVNGTPARARTALRPDAGSSGIATGSTLARPRQRRVPGQ